MSEITNPPAFPIRDLNEHPGPTGMTLRDWFAGKALSGITRMLNDPMIPSSACAQMAYHLADEMLKERAK